jgi:dihydropteroate synthase
MAGRTPHQPRRRTAIPIRRIRTDPAPESRLSSSDPLWKAWSLTAEERAALSGFLEERKTPFSADQDEFLFRATDETILLLSSLPPFREHSRMWERAARGPSRRCLYDSWGLSLSEGKVAIMGVLNVTPDSFSDGGRFFHEEDAVHQGLALAKEGADLIDVGGESTRPGSEEVPAEEEAARIVPVIEALAPLLSLPVSVDTRKAAVAEAALRAGATIVNDVTGLRHDPDVARVAADHGAGLVLNHIRGTPKEMQLDPHYDDTLSEVFTDLAESVEIALVAGVAEEKIALDPGIGFGKRVEDNLLLLRRLSELRSLGFPLLVGPSRKAFLGRILDLPVDERLEGTIGASVLAVRNGADMLRVHDVAAVARAVRIAEAIEGVEG